MGIEVDPAFKGTGVSWQKRRRWRIVRRLASVLVVFLVATGLTFFALQPGADDQEQLVDGAEGDDGLILIQSEDTATADVLVVDAGAEVFLDLRGEPMILTLEDFSEQITQTVRSLQEIDPLRAPLGAELQVINDRLLLPGANVQITIPSSSADLAAYQARRATAVQSDVFDADLAGDGDAERGELITVEDGEASWGELIGGGDDADAETSLAYVDTVIENTTTSLRATGSVERRLLFRDAVVTVEKETELDDLLEDQGLAETEVDRVLSQLERVADEVEIGLDGIETLAPGSLVALRFDKARRGAHLMQLSVYSVERQLISVAQRANGRVLHAVDPWANMRLQDQASRVAYDREQRQDVRLKDAIYGAILRNGVPTDLSGELMVLLSKRWDLDKITGKEDRLALVFAKSGRGALSGRILYVGIRDKDGKKSKLGCYVVPTDGGDTPFECFDPNQTVSSTVARGGGGLAAGYLTPVAGTKTSSFGPRNHPILKRMVNHNGVDWAAPTGTPVSAAAAGKITRIGVAGGYGNVVYIAHAGGAETRYAHLNSFAKGLKNGDAVQAGQLIGYVGTTGRSTGPHLHFELRVNGKPIDPLSAAGTRSTGAVEALVNQIIRVESAGNARAKNSRSSATGLGQFISSTWIRMMQTYRPDLVKSLSRQELLDLRFDPALSRAMVTNLARENEAYLQARNHGISPGRLYLAHFLGPKGADIALRANPEATVLEVMGAAVVKANPFLRGKTVGWMTNWSDRKMSRVKGGNTAITVVNAPKPVPPEVKEFKAAMDGFLEVHF